VQIRFLLGPAGSGKTHSCLAEIREALRAAPEGRPLILLAPKQATFQLERQLLTEGTISGYTRLHILSFERLAQFVFEQLGLAHPELLAEEGRVMVLRALLEKKRTALKVFHASARMPGFARQLSQLLRELQQYQLSADRLQQLADQMGTVHRLSGKLHDLGLMIRAYMEWLEAHRLQDTDSLLDLAVQVLNRSGAGTLSIESLWLDGFAQMTPQERTLLRAILKHTRSATLAFCLDSDSSQKPPWHSAWAPVTETYLRCRDEFSTLPDVEVRMDVLERNPARSRYASQPMLEHLERHWTRPAPFDGNARSLDGIRLVSCPNPEMEVEFAAREILRLVRGRNGRFRDIAVLLRSLDGHHSAIRRVFNRFEIPFFLDRRESVSHHPLAELTRYALRVAAFGWEHDDWFGALKTGLVYSDEGGIDWLENEALAHGWRGKAFWSEPIRVANMPEKRLERLEELRQKLVPPFATFCDVLTAGERQLNGTTFSAAIGELWRALRVDRTLQRWSESAESTGTAGSRLHETVWEQMTEWLDNIRLAFGNESLSLQDWLSVVEAGLANLTVGVIPPALDQVLVGAVDRSRNPDLRFAFVLGMNEGVFPAAPEITGILSRSDRELLLQHDAPLGIEFLTRIGLERYYGYIACTRPRHQLVLTCSDRDAAGREMIPSVFITDIQRLFPNLEIETFSGVSELAEIEHWSEAFVPLVRNAPLQTAAIIHAHSSIESALLKWNQLRDFSATDPLPAELAERLYGPEIESSVSALEDLAACPFRFYIGHGLGAEERQEFEIDPREKGSFQHDVLKEFHLQLRNAGKQWRDVSPAEARMLVRQIGKKLLPEFKDGLFTTAQARRFVGEVLIEGLERLIETLICWSQHYQFDPSGVEISFGLPDSRLPAWRIDLDDRHALLLRGRIDRVDLCRIEETGEALAVVIDYKSSGKELDRVLLENGLQLQLLAYLGALEQFGNFAGELDVDRIIPAGAFYVALKGGARSAATRDEERLERERIRRDACQHRGRFDSTHLHRFDVSGEGGQFRFALNKDGSLSKRGNEALASHEFRSVVQQVKEFLRMHGQAIYSGTACIAPFRYGNQTACDFCQYKPVCRFDSWTQPFRVLRARTS